MDYTQAVLILLVLVIIYLIFKIRASGKPALNVFTKYQYFDANGTTPPCWQALEAYKKYSYMGNSSAGYAEKMGTDRVINDTANIAREWLGLPLVVYKTAEEKKNEKGKESEKKEDEKIKEETKPEWSIVFNSCASEGNNYILRCLTDSYFKKMGTKPHIIISSIEHKTTMDCAAALENLGKAEVTRIEICDSSRTIDPNLVIKAIKPNTILISIMNANNETGNLNQLGPIGKVARERGIFFHSDVVQTIGKWSIPVMAIGLDAITASMHKLYGPIGVGLLAMSPRLVDYLKDEGVCSQICGSQFDGLRGGTVNVAGIAASGQAMKNTWNRRAGKNKHLLSLRSHLLFGLAKMFSGENYDKFYGKDDNYTGNDILDRGDIDDKNSWARMRVVLLTNKEESIPNTLMFSIIRLGSYDVHNEDKRFCNVKFKKSLFARGFIISIGSACNTKLKGPSHVLKAIGAPFLIRSGTIRISMLDSTTHDQVDKLLQAIKYSAWEQISKF